MVTYATTQLKPPKVGLCNRSLQTLAKVLTEDSTSIIEPLSSTIDTNGGSHHSSVEVFEAEPTGAALQSVRNVVKVLIETRDLSHSEKLSDTSNIDGDSQGGCKIRDVLHDQSVKVWEGESKGGTLQSINPNFG